jgi:hypothetical protein
MESRHITIVGAGQSGLQLGIGLLDSGYDVTLVSNRTPEQIRSGSIASSQCMFNAALGHERILGLDLWNDAPFVEGISFTVAPPEVHGLKAMSWAHRLDAPAQSIDQRVKFPASMEAFEARGGKLLFEDAGIAELERYAETSSIVLVAAGKGEIAQLFDRDDERSTYGAPQRALALTYVHGMAPREEFSAVNFNLIPGVGEYFVFPALTVTGPCEIMVFEGLPGSNMDSWKGLSPMEHLENSLRILRTYVPWEAERCSAVELTDPHGVLQGRFPPTVRHPLAKLPSGKTVLGMADVVVLNDPITGQGSNNAAKCAASYLSGIIAHGDGAYDDEFKRSLFEDYFSYARHVADWTNTMLAPPAPHALEILGAAQENPEIARRFANGFDYPPDFGEWFLSEQGAADYLASFSPVR